MGYFFQKSIFFAASRLLIHDQLHLLLVAGLNFDTNERVAGILGIVGTEEERAGIAQLYAGYIARIEIIR